MNPKFFENRERLFNDEKFIYKDLNSFYKHPNDIAKELTEKRIKREIETELSELKDILTKDEYEKAFNEEFNFRLKQESNNSVDYFSKFFGYSY